MNMPSQYKFNAQDHDTNIHMPGMVNLNQQPTIIPPKDFELLPFDQAVEKANKQHLHMGEYFISYYLDENDKPQCMLVVGATDCHHMHFIMRNNEELASAIENIKKFLVELNSDIDSLNTSIEAALSNYTEIKQMLSNIETTIRETVNNSIKNGDIITNNAIYWNEFDQHEYLNLTK